MEKCPKNEKFFENLFFRKVPKNTIKLYNSLIRNKIQNSMFSQDLDDIWKNKIHKKIIFLMRACKIYPYRITLVTQYYTNSVFYKDLRTFWKKWKILEEI